MAALTPAKPAAASRTTYDGLKPALGPPFEVKTVKEGVSRYGNKLRQVELKSKRLQLVLINTNTNLPLVSVDFGKTSVVSQPRPNCFELKTKPGASVTVTNFMDNAWIFCNLFLGSLDEKADPPMAAVNQKNCLPFWSTYQFNLPDTGVVGALKFVVAPQVAPYSVDMFGSTDWVLMDTFAIVHIDRSKEMAALKKDHKEVAADIAKQAKDQIDKLEAQLDTMKIEEKAAEPRSASSSVSGSPQRPTTPEEPSTNGPVYMFSVAATCDIKLL